MYIVQATVGAFTYYLQMYQDKYPVINGLKNNAVVCTTFTDAAILMKHTAERIFPYASWEIKAR